MLQGGARPSYAFWDMSFSSRVRQVCSNIEKNSNCMIEWWLVEEWLMGEPFAVVEHPPRCNRNERSEDMGMGKSEIYGNAQRRSKGEAEWD